MKRNGPKDTTLPANLPENYKKVKEKLKNNHPLTGVDRKTLYLSLCYYEGYNRILSKEMDNLEKSVFNYQTAAIDHLENLTTVGAGINKIALKTGHLNSFLLLPSPITKGIVAALMKNGGRVIGKKELFYQIRAVDLWGSATSRSCKSFYSAINFMERNGYVIVKKTGLRQRGGHNGGGRFNYEIILNGTHFPKESYPDIIALVNNNVKAAPGAVLEEEKKK